MRLPVKGDEKWEILSKIVDKLETRETKKALARNGITPVNKAIKLLKVVILAMFFELEISYAVSKVNRRLELRKFLKIEEEVKLRSVYSFMAEFEVDKFISFVFSILSSNSKKRPNKPSILILDWTDVSLDLNPFRKRDLKNKPYKWGYSRILSGNEDDDSDRLQNFNALVLPRLSSKRSRKQDIPPNSGNT